MIATKPRNTWAMAGAVTLAALTLGACSTLQSINPFASKDDTPEATTSRTNRVPILGLDQTVQASDALRGVDFFIPPPAALDSWPLPGGTPEQSVEHVDAAANFVVAWKVNFGRGSGRDSHVTAPPIVADGRVYVMDGRATVSAFDVVTGRLVWHANVVPHTRRDGGDGYGGGVAYADGKLYVTTGFREVLQLDAATGTVGWRTKTDAPIHAAPTVSGGRVFAVSVDDSLLTFDAATGAAGWTYQALSEPARLIGASSPAVAGDTVVAAFASGEVVALRTANGNDLWNQALSRVGRSNALSEIRDIAGRPVIYRGAVYAVSHAGSFGAIDLRTGQPRWSLPVSGISTPWAAGDVIYVISKAGEVICASRENGSVYWIRDLNEGRERKNWALWAGPVLAGGKLIAVSNRGEAVAIDPKTGEVKSTLKLGEGSLIAPIAVAGTVFVVTDDASLIAIR